MSPERPENKPAEKRPATPWRKALRALKLRKRPAVAADTSTAASRREARKANAAKAAAAKERAARSGRAATAKAKSAKTAKTAKSAKAAKATRPSSRPKRAPTSSRPKLTAASRAGATGARKRRTLSDDARKLSGPVPAAGTEAVKLGRMMLMVPARAFMAVAELAGGAVLWAWRRLLWPAVLAIRAFLGALVRLGQRHVTPARGVVVVAIFAVGALAASQWLDYRGVSVGSDAYAGSVAAVAPAPDIETGRAGDAHAWVMLPLALAALLVVVIAARGRPRTARLLIGIGIAAIAISLLVDVPKGLDEGEAAVAYQGAEARLLDGFWMQIVTASVLVACGALLPRYLRSTPASAPLQTKTPRANGRLGKLAAGARTAARRATPGKRKVQGART